jgi:hypothetical protein
LGITENKLKINAVHTTHTHTHTHTHPYIHRRILFNLKKERIWSGSSVYCLPSLYAALGSYLSPEKKMKKILPFSITWLNLEDITQSEISQIQKDKHCIGSLPY